MEQQLQQSQEIVKLVDIGVLEEDYSSEWASQSFAIPKKKRNNKRFLWYQGTQPIVET
jgi:hypothetical protein